MIFFFGYIWNGSMLIAIKGYKLLNKDYSFILLSRITNYLDEGKSKYAAVMVGMSKSV